jgi:hypothetical protein
MIRVTNERRRGPAAALKLWSRLRQGAITACCMAACTLFGQATTASGQIAAANIVVEQIDWADTTNSIRLTVPLSINSFQVDPGSDRGDIRVRIGSSASDDVQQGVLLSSVAENGRKNFGTNNYAVSSVHAAGSYRISTFAPRAQTAEAAIEYNVNVSAAWFPYAHFTGGVALNSSGIEGATNNLLIGSPGLILGTHFRWVSNGVFLVDLRGLGIRSTLHGVLLVNGARDENNFALSQPNADGTWLIYLRDNAQPNYRIYEQDPVAFVFIPRTNTSLVSGRFNGDASIAMFSGESPAFTVTNLGTGRWDLRIPGYTPADGVLVISGEGGGTYNGDNIVSYAPNATGTGWEIQSRDTPGNGLQTPTGSSGEPEGVASFVFIPAARAVPLNPAPRASNIGSSPRLDFAISNIIGGEVSVTVYGREKPTPPLGADFSIVVLPDTQYYTAERYNGKKEMFIAQTEWAITNKEANVAYVSHLGDISDSGDIKNGLPNTTEWRNATNAMYRLENTNRTQKIDGMPYGLAVGNHDQEPIGDPTGTTIYYNQYFGVNRFLGRTYYGGNYGNNNNNHYDLFSAGGLDFIVVYFEYDPGANPAVLAWANDLLQTHADRRAIAVTHYMGSARTPSTHSAQGAAIYNALKTNRNLFLLLGGHVTGDGSRIDTFNGNVIRTLISDYQGYVNGGNGFMRIMTFSPSNNVVTVQTYSPWTGQYESDEDSEFFFGYDMRPLGGSASPGTPWVALTNVTMQPGGTMSVTWPGLKSTRTYEWYATATDQAGNVVVTGPQIFFTGTNMPPASSNVLARVKGDEPTALRMLGTDPNQDPLVFRNNSLPMYGLLQNFDSATGEFIYAPVRGFRGSDRFTYHVTDGQFNSPISTFNLLVEAPTDSNGNGLPDAWEQTYGVTDPGADPDGDGQSNLAEYLANTNPTNAASVFAITSATRQSDGSVLLNWQSTGGTRYRILYSDAPEVGFSGIFTELARDLMAEMDPSPYGTASLQSYEDETARTNAAGRFYRIRVVQ